MIARLTALAMTLLLATGVAASAQIASAVSTYAGITIVRQPDPASSLFGLDVSIPAGLDRETLAQNGLAALTAQVILETPVAVATTPGSTAAMMRFETAVDAAGGSVSFDVDGGDVRFYLEGVAGDANTNVLMAMFAQALFKPSFDAKTVDAARAELDRKIARNETIPYTVGAEMLDRQFFTQANEGLPEYGSASSLAQFVAADARGFYRRNYRAGGVVISAVGAPSFVDRSYAQGFTTGFARGTSTPVVVKVAPLVGASREMIAHRDVGAPWMIAQYTAPELGSKDFAAMLVLSALIDKTLAQAVQVPDVVSHSLADRSVGSVYNFADRPASLMIYVDGGLGDASTNFASALAFVKVIDTVKLTGSFDEFKALAQGNYVADASALADRAYLASLFARDGGSSNYLDGTLASIAAVTPADVQRVARKYLGNPTVALIVPRETTAQ